MAKFESHITVNIEHKDIVKHQGEQLGWKFSQIDGDAIMLNKPWCYLTAYDSDCNILRNRMNDVVVCLVKHGIIISRLKIERIIYDTKTGVDELETR